MGQVDIEKEHPNVTKMKILGCDLIPVTRGTATLKDVVDSAFEAYLKDPVNYLYAIGSVVGKHTYSVGATTHTGCYVIWQAEVFV